MKLTKKHLPTVREDSPLYHPNIYPSEEQVEQYKQKKLLKKQKKAIKWISADDEEDDTLLF